MRSRPSPLLCELHAHTTWSDGLLRVRELVDLYGRSGFDVLCVTDHAVPEGSPDVALALPPEAFGDYLAEIAAEAERARRLYGLLVVPGLELTFNDADPDRAAHAVAIGLRRPVPLDDGLERALWEARAAGAALVAAHPSGAEDGGLRATRRFWRERPLCALLDRYELFNRNECFPWVVTAGLHVVASGDFHRPEHLWTWKTLLPCAREERAVVRYLRSPRPVFLTRLSGGAAAPAAA
jgi:predicted metal-dependent phosphoesterase TrpH